MKTEKTIAYSCLATIITLCLLYMIIFQHKSVDRNMVGAWIFTLISLQVRFNDLLHMTLQDKLSMKADMTVGWKIASMISYTTTFICIGILTFLNITNIYDVGTVYRVFYYICLFISFMMVTGF